MNDSQYPSIKELVEEQGLTVHQLRMTLARLEKQGYGSLPIVLTTDDDASVLTCSERECHGLGAYVVIG